jgi:hypothetical protein
LNSRNALESFSWKSGQLIDHIDGFIK